MRTSSKQRELILALLRLINSKLKENNTRTNQNAISLFNNIVAAKIDGKTQYYVEQKQKVKCVTYLRDIGASLIEKFENGVLRADDISWNLRKP
jgi:hypothetical protein